MKVAPLAEKAVAATDAGETRFVPELWKKTYDEWMRNIRDWCVSRQLWWGHEIPAWYCPDGHVTVPKPGERDPAACATCGVGALLRDPDVFDTWFSSWLMPLSVLGWPEKTADFARYYPTSVLVTAFDILFFWVARMIMAGSFFDGRAPFADVVLHGLVRDEKGQKMSKTKGNVVDPLDMCDEFGADAVRFTLAVLSGTGRDLPFGKTRVAGYRAFATKVWNAARFALQMLEDGAAVPPDRLDFASLGTVDRWILARLSECDREGERRPRGVPLRRGGERALPVLLVRLLRRLRRDGEARPPRRGRPGGGEGEDAGRPHARAARLSRAPPPVHAVRLVRDPRGV